jgi:hypothetical protein
MENISNGVILGIIDAVAIIGTTVYLNNKIDEIKNEKVVSKTDVNTMLKIIQLEKRVDNIEKNLMLINNNLNFLVNNLNQKGILEIKKPTYQREEPTIEELPEDDNDDDILLALKKIN